MSLLNRITNNKVWPAAILCICLAGCGQSPEMESTTLEMANVQGSSFDEPVTSSPVSGATSSSPVTPESGPSSVASAATSTASVAAVVSETTGPDSADLPLDIASIATATPVPTSSPEVVQTPVPAPPKAQAAPPAVVASGDFSALTFDLLSSFKYEEPIPQEGEKPEDVEKRRDTDQIPAEVKALNGKKAVVQGWMVPMEVSEDGSVKSFVLVKTQPQCCFGDMQAMNEWVDVVMTEGKNAEFNVDVPVKVYGQFEVGEKMQDGFVLSIYRMQGERVEL